MNRKFRKGDLVYWDNPEVNIESNEIKTVLRVHSWGANSSDVLLENSEGDTASFHKRGLDRGTIAYFK